MQEHVLPTIIGRHEAKAAHLVEPLDGTVDGVGRTIARPTTAGTAATEIAPRTVEAATGASAGAHAAATKVAPWRRTVAEAATTTTTAAAEATGCAVATARGTEPAGGAEVTPGRTVTKITARRAEAAPVAAGCAEAAPIAAGGTEAATAAKIASAGRATKVTPRWTVTKIATGRAIAKAAGRATWCAEAAWGTAAGAALQLGDPRHQTSAGAVGPYFADQNIVGVGLFDARIGERGGMEKHILIIRSQDESKTLTPVIPLNLGFNQPAFRHIVRHVGAQSKFDEEALRNTRPRLHYVTRVV